MTSDNKSGNIVEHAGDQVPVSASESKIVLSDTRSLSTTGLSETQIQELRMHHAKGMIDLERKAHELNIDVRALDNTLSTMADQTKEVSKSGDSVTMSHSHDSSLGRTEVLMGNTEKAAKGKLSKSQTGEEDHTMKIVIIIAIVVVVGLIAAY
jgi:hypothetical protein